MSGYFRMGPETHAISMEMYRENRERTMKALKTATPGIKEGSVVLLQGGQDKSLYDTDVDYVFRQESYFTYLFGVTEPGCYGCVDVFTCRSLLFVPRLPEEYAVWMGRLLTKEDFKLKYQVDEVHYADEVNTVLASRNPAVIYVLKGKNSDSGLIAQPADFEGIDKFNVDYDALFPVIAECRVIKSPKEIEVLRYVCKVSSDAHKKVMKYVRDGVSEYEAEAVFLEHSYRVGGCRHVSYTCICGSGENSAILHYGHAAAPNDKILRDGDMCLFDMGANYGGYAADITCSFPANGRFTADQKIIYEAVLDARNAVLEAARPGVSWVEMHRLANRTMLKKLTEGGLLKGDVDEMMRAGINGVFQPHGLGHLIGLDVHDVGGYLSHCPPRPTEPGFKSLRFARPLQAGMYVTVEPGCYFIDILLDRALKDPQQSRFLIPEAIARFRGFGGVRIEDDVLITENGCENFTKVPRTVAEIEAWMSSK
uniref:Xaa-Pro dipeptidase n=1 Tax=Lutzomyia longipalpis TaxID=7200 RepID=A0A1B0FV12_LUTLO